MDELDYVDVQITEVSWRGIAGVFILWSDVTHRDVNVGFSWDRATGALAVNGATPAQAARYRDAWLKDAESEWAALTGELKGLN